MAVLLGEQGRHQVAVFVVQVRGLVLLLHRGEERPVRRRVLERRARGHQQRDHARQGGTPDDDRDDEQDDEFDQFHGVTRMAQPAGNSGFGEHRRRER